MNASTIFRGDEMLELTCVIGGTLYRVYVHITHFRVKLYHEVAPKKLKFPTKPWCKTKIRGLNE